MSRVLVTGASGFVGAHVVRELQARGHTVRALSRSATADTAVSALGAQPCRGSLDGLASLRHACDGCDAVFHLAADASVDRREAARQTATNVDGTTRLLAAATDAGVRAFLHTSSISAYSHLVTGAVDETTPQRGGDSWVSYERSKHAGEQQVRASALPWIVFHPTHVLGAGDRHNWARLIRMIDDRSLPGVPPGLGVFADVREIARAQVNAWERQRFGQSYLLGGEIVELVDFVARIGRALDRPTPRRATPRALLLAVAWVQYRLAILRGQPALLTPESAAIASRRQRVSSDKAVRELDYRITPLGSLIEDTLGWMRREGMLGASALPCSE
jgi:nucleoside-diphosphate-sugar epimerase